MEKIRYTPHGVCTREMIITLDGDTVVNIEFIGGCSGNTQGVASLCRGMKVDEVIKRLDGIDCGGKGTSCPNELAKALKKARKAV